MNNCYTHSHDDGRSSNGRTTDSDSKSIPLNSIQQIWYSVKPRYIKPKGYRPFVKPSKAEYEGMKDA